MDKATAAWGGTFNLAHKFTLRLNWSNSPCADPGVYCSDFILDIINGLLNTSIIFLNKMTIISYFINKDF